MDIFFNLLAAFPHAFGLLFCLFFLFIALAIFAWWVYSVFFSAEAIATVVGIRAYEDKSAIGKVDELDPNPHNMHSPLLFCKLENGAAVNGTINSSQNWIPLRWTPGHKIKVTESYDKESFHEHPGYLSLLISLIIGAAACGVASSLKINIYSVFVLIFLILLPLCGKGRLGKFYNFITKTNWKELKQKFASDNQSFRNRKNKEKTWHTLSKQEISTILKQQYRSFLRATLPIMLAVSGGMFLAAYKLGEKAIHKYLRGVPIPEIMDSNGAPEFMVSLTLAALSLLLILSLFAKAINGYRQQNSSQINSYALD